MKIKTTNLPTALPRFRQEQRSALINFMGVLRSGFEGQKFSKQIDMAIRSSRARQSPND
jgi:hypothetical protein